jgi:nitroimidazol reductase NimA-like FMN-containing flavoprotein (pyridoxamine 5'-phosphate oxidase superfamily)
MNRRNQIQLTPEDQAKFLQEQQKCALATLDKNGFPHMVAMNYAAKDGVIYMTSYGKVQKVLNVRRNPKVGVMVEAGKRYAELRGVMIRGYCEISTTRSRLRQSRTWSPGGRADQKERCVRLR